MRKQLQITALRLGGPDDTAFFERESATLEVDFHARLARFAKTGPGDLRLHGFVSDDEYRGQPAQRAALARARAKAVADFLGTQDWKGRYEFTQVENDAAYINYHERRKVVCRPLEDDGESMEEVEPEAEPPAPADFEDARKAAVGNAAAAITALEEGALIANQAAMALFGEVKLADLAKAVRSMHYVLSRIREVGKPTDVEPIPRFKYFERGGPNRASTVKHGDQALIKFGPKMKEDDIPGKTDTFVHESAHAAEGIKAEDHAYAQDRLFKFLRIDQKYKNADHYELLVKAIASGKLPVIPETDTYPGDLARAKQLAIGGAIAFAEIYLRFSKQEVYHTYRYAWLTVNNDEPFKVAYDDTLADLRSVFGADLSEVVLTGEDLDVFAGVHFRLLKLLDLLDGEKVKVSLADETSFNTETNQLKIANEFFDLTPRKQVKSVLAALAGACNSVPSVDEEKYVDLAKTIARSQNRLC